MADGASDPPSGASSSSSSDGPELPGSSDSTLATPANTSSGEDSTSIDPSMGTGTTSNDLETGGSTTSPVTATAGGSESSTGGEPDEPPPSVDFACCEPGCAATLEQGHVDLADLAISGNRMLSHELETKSVLWDRDTRRPIYVEHGAIWAGLAGDIFWTADLSTFRWRDANDGALLGETDAGARRGAALDGSYLWVGTASGLTILDIDGAELWFEPGNFTSMSLRGLAETVYVLAHYESTNSIRVIDLALGQVAELEFSGEFAGWFADGARWFTREGLAYRVYEDTGEDVAFGLGDAMWGYGNYILIDYGVRTIDAPNDVLVPLQPGIVASGGAILSPQQNPQLVELLPDGVVQTPFVPPSEAPLWTFAYEGGEWVTAGNYGLLLDGEGKHYAPGRIDRLDGATSGRLAASSHLGTAYVWDIGDACNVVQVAQVERAAGTMAIADGGAVLAETHSDGEVLGTRLLSLPDVAEVGFLPGGTYESFLRVSDDGAVVGRWGYDPGNPGAVVQSLDDLWAQFDPSLPIYIAPNGAHAVVVERDNSWNGPEYTYVIDDGGVVEALDGLSYGFLDDDRMVLGRYESQICVGNFPCEVFLGAEIVTLDGTVVQSTPLPEVPSFERVTSTEILVAGPPRILDAYTGDVLWTAEFDGLAAAVGPDHVVVSDGGDLIVHRWR